MPRMETSAEWREGCSREQELHEQRHRGRKLGVRDREGQAVLTVRKSSLQGVVSISLAEVCVTMTEAHASWRALK